MTAINNFEIFGWKAQFLIHIIKLFIGQRYCKQIYYYTDKQFSKSVEANILTNVLDDKKGYSNIPLASYTNALQQNILDIIFIS